VLVKRQIFLSVFFPVKETEQQQTNGGDTMMMMKKKNRTNETVFVLIYLVRGLINVKSPKMALFCPLNLGTCL